MPYMYESADSATSLLESQTTGSQLPPPQHQQQSSRAQPQSATATPPPVVIVSSRSNTLNSSLFNNLLFSSSAAASSSSSSGGRTSRRAGRGRNRRIRASRRNNHLSNHVTLMNHHLSHRANAAASSSSSSTGAGASSCTYAFSLSTSPTCFSLLDANKKSERNLLSACCAVFCVAVLAVSLVETRWFYLNGGGCNLNHIGVADFFAPGRLEYTYEPSQVEKTQIPVYSFILPNGAGKLQIFISRLTLALSGGYHGNG